MNSRSKFSRMCLVSTMAAATLFGSAGTAFAAGAIKAAYVEQVIPSKTYTVRMFVLNSTTSVGPGTGILGITSLTLTNFDTSAQQVFIFVPIFATTGGCGAGGSQIIGGTEPQMDVYVQPQSTLHLTYPTPLVINPYAGITCIAAVVATPLHGGSVQIVVNGVIN